MENNVELNPDKIGNWVFKRLGVFLLLYFIALTVYLSNRYAIFSIDTIPARYLSLSLLREGNLDLDEYRDRIDETGLKAAREQRGHLLSDFPVGTPFLAAPYYALGILAGLRPEGAGMIWLEKWAAANIMALAAAFFWFLLQKTKAPLSVRIVVWAIFAFGTSNWAPSSQGLWQHGSAEVFLILALLCLMKFEGAYEKSRSLLAGLFLGLSVFMRPTMGVLLPVWFIALFLKNRRSVIFFLFGSLTGLAPLVYYHLFYWGSIMKGGYFGLIREGNYFSTFSPLYHLAAHMFSPSRGFLIFSPFFILVPISLAPRLRPLRPDNYHARLWGFSSLALALVIICYRKWWTGYGYGPRYWTDLLPLLCLLSLPAATWLGNRSWGKCIIALLVLYCIFIQALGAWRYDAGWDRGVDVDKHPEACWNLRDNAIFYCLSGGASHAESLGSPDSYLINNNILHMGKPENNRFLYSGFYPQEAWGTWTRANYPAVIYFRLPRKQDGHLVFVVKAPSSPLSPKKIKFQVNGHLAGEHSFKNNAWESAQPDYVVLSLPAASLSGEWEKLKITCSEGTFKGAGFSYFFGFALIQFGWFDNETFLQLKARFSEYPYTR